MEGYPEKHHFLLFLGIPLLIHNRDSEVYVLKASCSLSITAALGWKLLDVGKEDWYLLMVVTS